MAFWNSLTAQLQKFRPGIMSKAEIGESLIMVCMHIEAGKEDSGHVHPFDQCGMVLEGQIEMFIGEERHLLYVNDCYFIPAATVHGWKTLHDHVKLLDICAKQP